MPIRRTPRYLSDLLCPWGSMAPVTGRQLRSLVPRRNLQVFLAAHPPLLGFEEAVHGLDGHL
jgi:hypothetical protein